MSCREAWGWRAHSFLSSSASCGDRNCICGAILWEGGCHILPGSCSVLAECYICPARWRGRDLRMVGSRSLSVEKAFPTCCLTRLFHPFCMPPCEPGSVFSGHQTTYVSQHSRNLALRSFMDLKSIRAIAIANLLASEHRIQPVHQPFLSPCSRAQTVASHSNWGQTQE